MTTTLLDYLEAVEQRQKFKVEAGTLIWGDGKLLPETLPSFYDYLLIQKHSEAQLLPTIHEVYPLSVSPEIWISNYTSVSGGTFPVRKTPRSRPEHASYISPGGG